MDHTIGIIGCGQLGKLLVETGFHSNRHTILLYSPTPPLCSKQLYSEWVRGSFDNHDAIVQFGARCDVVTFELENINVKALETLENDGNCNVRPSSKVLRIIQNKKLQKEFMIKHELPTASFISFESFESIDDLKSLPSENHPMIYKQQIGGYDGYGILKVTDIEELAYADSGILEECVQIQKELAVIVGRDYLGNVGVFPVTEMVMKDFKLQYSVFPSCVDDQIVKQAQTIATTLANKLDLIGIMAVEFFLTQDNVLLINEMSPRPHNSGHQTIDAYSYTNQNIMFAHTLTSSLTVQEIGAIAAPETAYILVNVISDRANGSFPNIVLNSLPTNCKANIYDYHKRECRVGRKMGHIVIKTIVREDPQAIIDEIRYSFEFPQVAVIMGSNSDLPTLRPALQILNEFKVWYEKRVVSAHRSPRQMIEFATQAEERGIKVIIAGAGGAAHLPGMVASATNLPVIGVPINSHNSIEGIDSLLSICQMPGGIPVATVGINGAQNAGLLAIRMLAINNSKLKTALREHSVALQRKVNEQNEYLETE